MIDIALNNWLVNTPNNIAKALLIDLPDNIYTAPFDFNINSRLDRAAICYGAYSIRSTIKGLVKETFNLNDEDFSANLVVSSVAGFVAGGLKYYVTGQNVLVGMLNNAAYEACGNFKYCKDHENEFAIIVETIDAVSQVVLPIVLANYPAGIAAVFLKIMDLGVEPLVVALKGFDTGVWIGNNSDNFYDPIASNITMVNFLDADYPY